MNRGQWYLRYVDFDSMKNRIFDALSQEKIALKSKSENFAIEEAKHLWKLRLEKGQNVGWDEVCYPHSPSVTYEQSLLDATAIQREPSLALRWTELCRRLDARGNTASIYNDLEMRYSTTNRVYHTLQHIEHCLNEFEQVRILAACPDAVEFAIWYHDSIYMTKAKDNELRSARLAINAIKGLSLHKSFGQCVADLIMATTHSVPSNNGDALLLVDIYLSILGQDEDTFDVYEQQIHEEYAWVPEGEFTAGRSEILKMFLDRHHIYATQYFRDKYEAQARKNIRRSLRRL